MGDKDGEDAEADAERADDDNELEEAISRRMTWRHWLSWTSASVVSQRCLRW